MAFIELGFGGEPSSYPGTYDLLLEGLPGHVLRRILPRVERGRGVVHHLAG